MHTPVAVSDRVAGEAPQVLPGHAAEEHVAEYAPVKLIDDPSALFAEQNWDCDTFTVTDGIVCERALGTIRVKAPDASRANVFFRNGIVLYLLPGTYWPAYADRRP